jgi:hypothetical protein
MHNLIYGVTVTGFSLSPVKRPNYGAAVTGLQPVIGSNSVFQTLYSKHKKTRQGGFF